MSLLNLPPPSPSPSPPSSPPPFHPAGANEVLIQNFRNQVEEFRMKERYQETQQNLAIFAIKERYVQCQNICAIHNSPPLHAPSHSIPPLLLQGCGSGSAVFQLPILHSTPGNQNLSQQSVYLHWWLACIIKIQVNNPIKPSHPSSVLSLTSVC